MAATGLLCLFVVAVALGKIAIPDSLALLLEATIAIVAILAEVLFQHRR